VKRRRRRNCIGIFINNEIGFLNEESADIYFRVNAEDIQRLLEVTGHGSRVLDVSAA